MPTTSNFGWTTPADTDLVKDGAAAIRTLGNGIDTSLVDLKGGTSGQVLSKNSNTDLDYTWVTPNVGDITEVQAGVGISVASGTGPIPVITNSSTDLITTAGDLLYGTAADTVARLGIGTAGQVLKVNSGATAPEWGAAAAGANWSLANSGGTALTGAATITISGLSNVDKIMVLVENASSANAGSALGVRLNGATSGYFYCAAIIIPGATYSANAFGRDAGSSSTLPLATLSGNAGSQAAGYVRIDGCNSAGVKLAVGAGGATATGSDTQTQFTYGGYYNSASVITSVSLFSSSGNFDNGTIYVYTSA